MKFSSLIAFMKEEFLPILIMILHGILFSGLAFIWPLIIYLSYRWKIWFYLSLLYYAWIHYDSKTLKTRGRKVEWLKYCSIFNCLRDYFPLRLIKTAELPPDKNYGFICYPHGSFPSGPIFNLLTNINNISELYPGLDFRAAFHSSSFSIPVLREYLMALGGCTSDGNAIRYVLSSSPAKVVVMCPGGIKEALVSQPGNKYTIVKDNRKGFVKIALQTGCALVPVFSFGENNILEILHFDNFLLRCMSNLAHKLGRIKIFMMVGRKIFNCRVCFAPHRRPVTTVVGGPIHVPKVEDPSPALIDEYHERFHDALRELFEKNKKLYDEAGDDATLETI